MLSVVERRLVCGSSAAASSVAGKGAAERGKRMVAVVPVGTAVEEGGTAERGMRELSWLLVLGAEKEKGRGLRRFQEWLV